MNAAAQANAPLDSDKRGDEEEGEKLGKRHEVSATMAG